MLCTSLSLLTTPALLHYVHFLQQEELQHTALHSLLYPFETGNFMKKLMKWGVLPLCYLFFACVALIALCIQSICCKKRLQRLSILQDNQDESQMFKEWNKLQRMVYEELRVS